MAWETRHPKFPKTISNADIAVYFRWTWAQRVQLCFTMSISGFFFASYSWWTCICRCNNILCLPTMDFRCFRVHVVISFIQSCLFIRQCCLKDHHRPSLLVFGLAPFVQRNIVLRLLDYLQCFALVGHWMITLSWDFVAPIPTFWGEAVIKWMCIYKKN